MWSIWVCATVVSAEALGIWIYWTSRARKTASEPLNAFFVESANGVVSLVRLSAAAAMAWEENSSGVNLNARLGALEVTWMTVLLFLFYVVIILSELSTYWHSHGGGEISSLLQCLFWGMPLDVQSAGACRDLRLFDLSIERGLRIHYEVIIINVWLGMWVFRVCVGHGGFVVWKGFAKRERFRHVRVRHLFITRSSLFQLVTG